MGLSEREMTMPDDYAHYQFRLQVLAPVAADSPFDSDTLWGRILCALTSGSKDEQVLAEKWLSELNELLLKPNADWQPPLLASEGFQCEATGEPWLPVPLAFTRQLEKMEINPPPGRQPPPRKELKKIERAPLRNFVKLCEGQVDVWRLLDIRPQAPGVTPAIHPHLSMDRLSGKSLEGQLYVTALNVYSPPEILFFLRLRKADEARQLKEALKHVCEEGWGSARSRGLGRLCFKSFEPWQPPTFPEPPDGFVSLSHFCPAANDPTDGLWKLQAKHPVPAQFVNGKRVALGEKDQWRVKSFLRLRAGSCFRLDGGQPARPYYGRMLNGLLDPALDGEAQPLPALFHYALAFPVPMRWPKES